MEAPAALGSCISCSFLNPAEVVQRTTHDVAADAATDERGVER